MRESESHPARDATRWLNVVLLGFATVGAYGTAQYAIGTLLPAIAAETGWGLSALSVSYAVSVFGQGVIALVAGREFDHRGSRNVLLPALLLGAVLLWSASSAGNALFFSVLWGIGGAAFGGGLYYSMTIPMVSRLYPAERTKALAILTFIGALAAPIFAPTTALLIETFGWRDAVRALVVLSFVLIGPAAWLVRAPGARSTERLNGEKTSWLQALSVPAVRRALLVLTVGGMANTSLLIYQVSMLQAAGLSLAAASGFAGARGGSQILGRMFLVSLTARFGTRGAMALCYGGAATAAVAVGAAGVVSAIPAATYFAIVGGACLGLLSPLQGLFQAESYGDEWLGRLNGVAVVAIGATSAVGTWSLGVLADRTEGFGILVAVIASLQVVALLVVFPGFRRTRSMS